MARLPGRVDVALLSLGTTLGLRRADDALAALLADAGASCRVLRVRMGSAGVLRRQITAIDAVEGLAARRAARGGEGARAVIVSGATTALLIERPRVPWALRFDSPTLLNRPGVSGALQRARERRVLPAADLLLPWGQAAADAVAPLLAGVERPPPVVPLPVPIEVPQRPAGPRDPVVLAYAGWPEKRGLDVLCAAWAEAAPAGHRLVIGGCARERGLEWLARSGVAEPPGTQWLAPEPRDAWLALLARATLFVNASRREDHGLAQLEALALGVPLVTVASPGPYEALPIARRLAPQLVAAEVAAGPLAEALRAGLKLGEDERATYARAAVAELTPYRREAILERVRTAVLPALGL